MSNAVTISRLVALAMLAAIALGGDTFVVSCDTVEKHDRTDLYSYDK